MTDAEIMEALRVCSMYAVPKCEICPYYKQEDCVKKSADDALNLIQRQQAEIKKLKKKIGEFPVKVIVGHNSEVHSKTMADYDSLIGDIAAEGIKEVKDRIVEQLKKAKDEFSGGTLQEHYYRKGVVDAIAIVKGVQNE